MARLHEFQSKALLAENGLPIPSGKPARTPAEARQIAQELARPVVVKAQAWVTGRAGLGAVRFAETPDEAEDAAAAILGMAIGSFAAADVKGLVDELNPHFPNRSPLFGM